MNLKTIITSTALVFSLALVGIIPAARAESPGYIYVGVDRILLNSINTSEDWQYEAFDGQLEIYAKGGALRPGGWIQLIELELTDYSPLSTPDGYKRVSPIYEYEFRGTALVDREARIGMRFPTESTLEYDKFVMYYDVSRGLWREIGSETDLESMAVNVESGAGRLIFAAFDTDVMTYGHASWYRFRGCMCAASPDYPRGTQLLVTNLNQDRAIVVTVNDWGPERDIFPLRVIDLDVVAFEKFGSRRIGVLRNIKVTPFNQDSFDEQTAKDLLAGKVIDIK